MELYKDLTDSELKPDPQTGELVQEEWKSIPGYDGFYEVSNYGRVRSWKKLGCKGGWLDNPKILKPIDDQHGYYVYGLCKSSIKTMFKAHRLVGMMFVEKPDGKNFINHKDGIKTNNFYKNLEWCTLAENNTHARENGLNDTRGSKNSQSTLTADQVLEIRERYKEEDTSYTKLAKDYPVNRRHIGRIINKERWAHV